MIFDPATKVVDADGYVRYTSSILMDSRGGTLRVIDWFPYCSVALSSSLHLTSGIRTNDGKTVAEFKKWLLDLQDWIMNNRKRYKYLVKSMYEWQNKYFNKSNHVIFGDIESLNSPTDPKSTAKSQLIVHPEGVQLGDFRSSLGMCNAPRLDKSAPHGNPESFVVNHIIYWTDKRSVHQLSMITDAYIVQEFINDLDTYIETGRIDDNWILEFC